MRKIIVCLIVLLAATLASSGAPPDRLPSLVAPAQAGNVVMQLGGGVPVAEAPSWVPTDLTSLVAWWNTYTTNKIPTCTAACSDAEQILTWPDSKGSYTLTPYSTYAPLYYSNQQNGLATIKFVRASTYYLINTSLSMSTFPYTFWAVVKPAQKPPNGTDYTIVGPNNTGGITFKVAGNNSLGKLDFDSAGVAQLALGTGSPDITAAYHTVIGTIRANDTGDDWYFFVDGSAAGSGGHTATLTAGRTLEVGSNYFSNGGGDHFDGYIGEIGICNAVLSAEDRGSLQTYLKAKWGTP